jgi:predicted TIM-barrel fold metal-dependent hydrolase
MRDRLAGHPNDNESREDTMRELRRPLFGRCTCCPSGMDRREFVAGGIAALGIGAFAAATRNAAAQAKPHRIDVHHHISPPSWLDAVKKVKRDNPPMANWSPQRSLDDMDQAGIATAIVSPTTPQVNFLDHDKDAAARIARESNEYTKKLISDHPGRFGLFAMLPLPHIDASLEEIAYSFDTLKADGVGMMTSYGDKWLGYPQFAPIWEELNRRKATVYTHPTAANCCVNLVE